MTYNHEYTIWQNAWYVAKRAIRQIGWRFHLPALLCMLATALLPFVSALFPSTLIGLLTEGAKAQTIIVTILGFVIALGLFTLIASVARTYQEKWKLLFRLRDLGLYEKYFTFSYAYLETKQAGIDREAASKAHYWGSGWGVEKTIQAPVNILGAVISIILYAAVTATLHPLLVLVLLGCSCIQAVLIARNSAFEDEILKESTKIARPRSLLVQNARRIQSAQDIRSYQMADWFHEKAQGYHDHLIAVKYRSIKRKFAIQAAGRLTILIRDILCYGYLILQMFHGMDLASFTLYLSIFAGFTGYFEAIVQGYWDLSYTNPQISAFRNYMDEPTHRILTGSRPIPEGPHSFTFENVSFTYPEATESVLKNVSFTISAGEKLALVGLNGAGKSTLIKLLSGLYTPTKGRILMDGIDIREFNDEDYYRCIGTVFQDDFSLAFPLTENITCRPEGEEDEKRLWDCLTVAGLADKIRSFPRHIHTRLYQNIDPEGILLSGGEMQRLMLARALYKDADTLILDEPTAALDPLAEAAMYQNYHEISKNKTSLFISHRLSSTRFCDRILLLNEGCIAEEGTHQSLMQAGGLYADLFNTQAQYYQQSAAAPEEDLA